MRCAPCCGDPRYYLKNAKLLCCIAMVRGFSFNFGIHDASRTVWITKVAPPSQ